jgi:DNA primase
MSNKRERPSPNTSLVAEPAAEARREGPRAGRVPEVELERIKRDVSIVRLVEAQGVKLTGNGDNLLGRCPFHDDRTPSLVVSAKKNIWNCLGACRTGGSVIDWVMKAEGVAFRAAVDRLREDVPSLVASSAAAPRQDVDAAAPRDLVVLGRVAELYHEAAKDRPELSAYLERRGLRHAEMFEHFRIGYAERTLTARLPERWVKGGETVRSQLQRIGILRATGHEHFAGSLVIPIYGEDGSVLEMYGRKIHDNLRTGTPRHLYLPARPDGRRGVFNLAALVASKEIVICEALLDALTFWVSGVRNVTSAYGVENSGEVEAAFRAHGTKRVLIAYDRDEAGDRGAEKLAKRLAAEGIAVFRVLFPRGMDANQYALKVQPAEKSLELAIGNAVWMSGPRLAVVPDSISDDSAAEPAKTAPTAVSDEASAPAISAGAGAPPSLVASEAADRSGAAATAPPEPLDADVRDDEVVVRIGDRRWRVRGMAKATTWDSLHVNLLVAKGSAFYVDSLELYSARARASFLRGASEELKVEEQILKADLGRIVLRLEELAQQRIESAVATEARPQMTEAEREEALALLRDPRLLDRILADFDKAGVVGEETNKLVGYLAATSRMLEAPLAVVIQSSSAAGKSSIMQAILQMISPEEIQSFSAMTPQSLYYLSETALEHKILAIAEEEGAESASYALKLLQSEGEISIASTGKDAITGKHVTHIYVVKGPVMIFLTTTAIDIDPELLNRCIILTVDERPEQTAAIHQRQREAHTLEGLLARKRRKRVLRLHQNAQRLLEPLAVVNPLAKELRFPHHTTRSRRDHMKYLTLIDSIALLHQHQRPVKESVEDGERVRYVDVTEADIARANQLAAEVLFSTDELPPQTRRLLGLIEEMVAAAAAAQGIDRSLVRFTRRDVRNHTRWSDGALKKHLGRLEDLEHLAIHAGGARRRMVYQLASTVFDGRLVTPEGNWSPPGHGLVTPGGSPDKSGHENGKAELVSSDAKGEIQDGTKVSSNSDSPSNSVPPARRRNDREKKR